MPNLENYILNNGSYTPINAVPAGVVCKMCKLQYPISQINKHLNTHISIKFLTKPTSALYKQPKSNRIAFAQVINNIKVDEDRDKIYVKSMFPSEMPTSDLKLKEAIIPNRSLVGNKFITNPLYDFVLPSIDSQKNLRQQLQEQKEEQLLQQHLKLQKPILIKSVNANIKKKKLNFYKNQKLSTMNVDSITKTKKPLKLKTEENQPFTKKNYQVKEDRQVSEVETPGKYNYDPKLIKSQYDFHTSKKRLPDSNRFDTLSRYNSHSYFPPRLDIEGSQDRDHGHGKQKCRNMCQCCKGFYCSVCKSDIPPIYRPVPDQNGKYYFDGKEINPANIQFYRRHLALKQQCQNCGTNSDVRQLDFQKDNSRYKSHDKTRGGSTGHKITDTYNQTKYRDINQSSEVQQFPI